MPLREFGADEVIRRGDLFAIRAVWRGRTEQEVGPNFGVFVAAAQHFTANGEFARTPRTNTVETTPTNNGVLGQWLREGDVIGVAILTAARDVPARQVRDHMNGYVISGFAVAANMLAVGDVTDVPPPTSVTREVIRDITSDPLAFAGDIARGAGDALGEVASGASGALAPILVPAMVVIGAVFVASIYLRET